MNGAAIYGSVTTVIKDSVPANIDLSNYWYPVGVKTKAIDFLTTKELIDLYNKALTEFQRIQNGGVVYAYSVTIDRSQMSSTFKIYEVHSWHIASATERTAYITALFNDLNSLIDNLSYFGVIADGKTMINPTAYHFDTNGMIIVTDPATGVQTSTTTVAEQKKGSNKLLYGLGIAGIIFLLYKSF